MTTKVKGLLKGLRYISQIFDEKEEEIQIGFPTDVKHVAHIGSDDPSANAPSWMTEFKSGQEPSPGSTNATERVEEQHNSKDSKSSKIRHLIPKSKHHSTDNDSSTGKHKHTRRHRSSDSTSDGSVHDSSGGSRHRRHRRGSNHGSTDGSESASQELPPTGSKHSHRRKSKSVEEGSERKHSSRTSRRSKGDSLTDISLTEMGSGSKPEEVN